MPPKKSTSTKKVKDTSNDLTPRQWDNRYQINFWRSRMAFYASVGDTLAEANARLHMNYHIESQADIDANAQNELAQLMRKKGES